MEPPAACIHGRIAFLAQLPKSQVATWQLQSDLTLTKITNCSIDVLKDNYVKAFEFFRTEIRKNNYRILQDPEICSKLPMAFRRIRNYLKRILYFEPSVENLRIEIIANLPLKALGRSFMFDSETANQFLVKKRDFKNIPVDVYIFLTKRLKYCEFHDEAIKDYIRIFYLLTDCFKPFLIVLLPPDSNGSAIRMTMSGCKNIFIPVVNKLLELDDLTLYQCNLLETVFKNQDSRVYPLILQHYQPYWMRRFEQQCLNPEVDAERRIVLFHRLWCYYTPASAKDPSITSLTVKFLKSLFFELDVLIRNERCLSLLKKICLEKGMVYWLFAAKYLALEGKEGPFIEQKFLVQEGDALKVSDDWTLVFENLISHPCEFLNELFHSYQLSNHPTLFKFVSGSSFYMYPRYFLDLARECVGENLKNHILNRIARIDFSKHIKWRVILGLNVSNKSYDKLLTIAKETKNEVLIDICYTKLTRLLKIYLCVPPKNISHIEEVDFIKIVKQCVIPRSERRILTFDFAFYPLTTIEGIRVLGGKFANLNWINFPFDKDSSLCNVVLECDGNKIYLNTHLLSSVSEYFKSMFAGRWDLKSGGNKKLVRKLDRVDFEFFRKFLFLIFSPTSNPYKAVLSNPSQIDKIKKAFQIVFEGEENPIERCFELLGIALYYQMTHLFDLLDQLYTFAVTTWDVKYPDAQILSLYRRKDFKIWIFKEGLEVEKRKGLVDVNKYMLLRHTRLFKYFKLEQVLLKIN